VLFFLEVDHLEGRIRMSYSIRITAGETQVKAELNDSPTAKSIFDALPISASGNRWGEEIYFEIPVNAELARDAKADVDVGDLGYWPPGSAFCIFFGPTPVSPGAQPRAASPVNLIGRILDDAKIFTSVPDGAEIRLDKI
jgi:hypothetical protein